MDNFNIIGNNAEENGWQQLSQPVYADEGTESVNKEVENVHKKQKNKRITFSPVITFQLIVCLIFITVMYFSKTFMPSLFNSVVDVYSKEITTSMFFNGDFRKADYLDLFTATNDEA